VACADEGSIKIHGQNTNILLKEEGRMQTGTSGASDMHGKAARVAESKAGAERLNEERDLRDRTKQFALRILEMFSVIPKSTQAQVLGKQVLRSGTSVGANYREAYRGRSKAEFVAKCGDSLRELEEWSVLGGPRHRW
jgi:hypothetical protein